MSVVRAGLVLLMAFVALPAKAAVAIPTSARAETAMAGVRDRLSAKLADLGLRLGSPILIAIFKEERALEVWSEGPDGAFRHFRTYKVCNVSGRLGPKQREGDLQAPEGFYAVRPRQLNPQSRFHLSFNLGFPNAYDRAQGWTGSALMVHGACVSIGCFAMTDAGIEDIYTLLHEALLDGQAAVPVHVFPFRMSDARMAAESDSPWYPFWQSLKAGYDAFETTRRVPEIGVVNGSYAVRTPTARRSAP